MSVKPLPGYLSDRFRTWRSTRFAQDSAWYARLARAGQNPRTMLIACCDSRVDPIQLFAGEPGDFFVVRNVANLVPPSVPDRRHHGTSAAVEFAVKQLGVAHIVVLGHSGCGGVSACYDMANDPSSTSHEHVHDLGIEADTALTAEATDSEAPVSYIGNWLQLLMPAARRVGDTTQERAAALQTLEQAAVQTSLENLMTFDFVSQAVSDGSLTLHGAWIDIGAGELNFFDPEHDGFVPLG